MPVPLRLNAVAFISSQNQPILIHNYTSLEQDDLKYHYISHVSLDIVEEKLNSAKLNECYLGLLYSMEDLAVYGYVTPAKLKIIIALALSDAVVRDSDIVLVFKALHSAYRRSLANPFLKLYTPPEADSATMLISGMERFSAFRKRVEQIGQAVTGSMEGVRI